MLIELRTSRELSLFRMMGTCHLYPLIQYSLRVKIDHRLFSCHKEGIQESLWFSDEVG